MCPSLSPTFSPLFLLYLLPGSAWKQAGWRGWEGWGKGAQTMSTHVNKCKNDKMKGKKL
jgi:hypothetical protein